MPTTLRNTDILFNDSTTQSTAAPAGGISYQAFTSSGTFTIPAGVTKVKVTVVGGGGGGGAVNSGITLTQRGGGSGATAIVWLTGLTPGNTIGVTVGGAGAGGVVAAPATAGATGGASSIQSGTQTITTVTANGGTGGAANGGESGGEGGTASNGNLNLRGSDSDVELGGRNAVFGVVQRGNGTSASLYGNGGNGSITTVSAGGTGSAGIVVFEW